MVIKTLAVLVNNQKNYGKEYVLSDLFKFYEMKLAGRFPVDSILMAIGLYTDRNSDIPQPSDLINIMDPEKPKISYAEYKNALERHAQEGYQMFGGYKQIINEYEQQRTDETGIPTTKMIMDKRSEDMISRVQAVLGTTYGKKI